MTAQPSSPVAKRFSETVLTVDGKNSRPDTFFRRRGHPKSRHGLSSEASRKFRGTHNSDGIVGVPDISGDSGSPKVLHGPLLGIGHSIIVIARTGPREAYLPADRSGIGQDLPVADANCRDLGIAANFGSPGCRFLGCRLLVAGCGNTRPDPYVSARIKR